MKSFVRIITSLIGVLALSLDAAAGSTPAVQIGPTGRYLVDQNNAPFMLVGDSPQAIIGNFSTAQADQYFADRQAHGFNALWINLLCNNYTFCNGDGTTFDGIAPFTSPGDLSTPNAAYFQRAHDMVAAAGAHGLIVFLDPIETGGWLSVLQANGQTKAKNYGTYVGNFFKDLTNIVWLSGNDFQTWQTASDNNLVLGVAQAIKAVAPSQLHTVELNFLTSSSLDDAPWGATIGLNAAYTYSPTYAEVLHAYNQSSAIPTFMVEANYEYEHNPNTDGGQVPRYLRMQEYWTMLSGATGQFYGSCFTDRMSTPCPVGGPSGSFFTVIDSPGVTQLQYMAGLFNARAWYNLVPDQTHSVVTTGYGTFSSSGLFAGNNYVTAARTPDGTLVMAYLPTTATITVDMTKLAGPTTARWFDPTNNTFSAVAGSPFANTGTRQFTSPAANSSGDPDFVLVLELSHPSHDFNGDGKSDITWRDTSGNAAVWLMNGTQVIQSAGVGVADPNVWKIVGQRDFNGDGKADWLWRDNSGHVAMWFLNGTQVTQSAGVGTVPIVWSVAGTADFNGDGKGDILWHDSSGNVAIWLMNGAQVTQSAGVGATDPNVWNIVGTGDFNGDGKADILWQDGNGNVAIWFMNGDQVVGSAGVGNVPPTVWTIVGTGDFNGDGKSDILWRDTSGNVAIWLMNGAQIAGSAGLGNAPPSVWSIVETGDFNGDGKSDLLWHDTSGNVAIWFMNGTQVASAAGVGNAPPAVWTIQGANAD